MKNQQQKAQKKKKSNIKSFVPGNKRRENSNRNGPNVSNIKTMRNTSAQVGPKKDTYRISNREFVTDVVPFVNFTPTKIEINPAIASSFPWLSGLATSFQKYKIHKFKVIFETSQSSIVPGFVMMAPEFNISDSLPSSKQELLTYKYATRGPVWQNLEMSIKVEDMMQYKNYYIRNGTETNLLLYDPFYIVIASLDTTLSTNIGEIWFEYDIEFSIPQKVNQVQNEALLYKFWRLDGDFTSEKFFGTAQSSKGSLDVTIDQNDQVMTFNENFVGEINIITFDNFGEQDNMSVNPGVINVSNQNVPVLTVAVGGSGYNADNDPLYRTYSWDISMNKGDQLTCGDYLSRNRPTWMKVNLYKSNIYEPIVG